MPDKMSQEKIATAAAYGAEVVITPTPSTRLARELLLRLRPSGRGDPGRLQAEQYANLANPDAHYRTTGPEIWEQTGGELDAIVFSVGTGGTISGVGRYFKERKPEVLIVGADPEGSVSTADDAHPIGTPTSSRGSARTAWPATLRPKRRRRIDPRLRPRLLPDRAALAREEAARRRLGGSTCGRR